MQKRVNNCRSQVLEKDDKIESRAHQQVVTDADLWKSSSRKIGEAKRHRVRFRTEYGAKMTQIK